MSRLAIALRLYVAVNELEQKPLAKAWKCSESTVTRFLNGTAVPEAATMARIFVWCLEQETKS